ncbi:hypothetical protein Hypma_010046 [Hypsizygus marmoreus]|uniref:Uncharacterized protein n=1 Tax=Hypsizygus marmoreus TaxID=39966 RepID=A0A369JN82_HYPMA|nr:hypothetical protein Hypma_010046 [Hypsizygus marmoreus]
MSSVYSSSSIPTPPVSPNARSSSSNITLDHPLKPSIELLDNLVDFYQRERTWAGRIRASLDDADEDTTFDDISNSDESDALPSPPIESASGSYSQSTQSSRWLRRKKGFKLRLDSVDRKFIGSAGTHKPMSHIASRRQNHPQRERILEMFEKMMEARMESCQRVNRMIRNANRADLQCI